MNIDIEFAPKATLKSVVAFRLPFAYSGGGSDSDGDVWSSYKPQYINLPRFHPKPEVWLQSGSYGCSWIDATDEETIDFILTHLKNCGYTDIIIEEKLVLDDN